MPTESIAECRWGVRSFAMGAVGAAVVVVVVYLALASAFLAYPDHPGTVFCQELYTRKDALAHEAQGERVLIVGGSGALFSVRAEMIAAATGMPAINGATHAGLGAPYLLDRAARLVRPGDRVLLVPEHAYWHARAGRPFDDDLALRYVLTFDRGYLSDLGFPRGPAALLRAPTSDVLAGRDNARWRSKGSLLRDAKHYPVSRLSPAGDLELRTERRRTGSFSGVGLLPPEAMSHGWGRSISEFLEAVLARGGEARLAWPACVPRRDSVEYVAQIGRAGTEVAAGVGCETLGTAVEAVAIQQFFGDTPYHAIPVAAIARTWALIENLSGSWAPPRRGLFLLGWGSTRTSPSVAAIDHGCGRARWLTSNLISSRQRFVPPLKREQILDHLAAGEPVLFDDAAMIPQLGTWGFGYERVELPGAPMSDLQSQYPQHILAIASTTPGPVSSTFGIGAPGGERTAAIVGTGEHAGVCKIQAGSAPAIRWQQVLALATGGRLPVRLDVTAGDAMNCYRHCGYTLREV